MEYEPSDGITCEAGDRFEMHKGRPTLMRGNTVIAVAWVNADDDYEIRVPKPKPQFCVELECDWAAEGGNWTPFRIGPMGKTLAEKMCRTYSGSSYHRNVRIVEAAP